LIHRHLEAAPDTGVTALGLAALDDLLDRGDLIDWKPVLAEIARHPRGEVAERVVHLCNAHPRQGTSRLLRTWIERRRLQGPAAPRRTLAELRTSAGVSQGALAARIDATQSDLSKIERRRDAKLSTLRRVLAGLGYDLELRAVSRSTGDIVEVVVGE
jgi:DNA-binding XRE family transcriptional regulator